MKIAITGNIAAGKSVVQKILQNSGYKVLDTDKCGHTALFLPQVKNVLKHLDIFENGEISREKLGHLVFNNLEIKKELENVVHPVIKQNILDFFEDNRDEELLFTAIPLVFEAGMDDLFDKTVLVYADDKIRFKRLLERNGYDREYAVKRMNSQMSQDEKITRSDFVIYNNGTFSELNASVENLIQKLSKF